MNDISYDIRLYEIYCKSYTVIYIYIYSFTFFLMNFAFYVTMEGQFVDECFMFNCDRNALLSREL